MDAGFEAVGWDTPSLLQHGSYPGVLSEGWGIGPVVTAIPEEWLSLVHGDRRRGIPQLQVAELERLVRKAIDR